MLVEPAVFDETWVPDVVRHRDSEAETIASGVRPLLRGSSPGPVLVSGESGTGKTCTVTHLLDELEAGEGVQTAHVNCWINSPQTLYEDIHESVGGATLTRENTSPARLFPEIEAATSDEPLVLALDEADELGDAQFFYRFSRCSNIALVLIAHTPEKLRRSIGEERTLSRLGPMTRVPFGRYGVDEMVDILHDRAKAGLEGGSVDAAQLRAIAQTAANAHEAIETLRKAADAARERGLTRIQDSLIQSANDDARQVLRERRLRYLDAHQLALYEIVSDTDTPLKRSAIGARYRERVEEPRSSAKWVRDQLSKLASYDLIEAVGETKARRYTGIEDAPDAATVRA